jgi:hypothetical protein
VLNIPQLRVWFCREQLVINAEKRPDDRERELLAGSFNLGGVGRQDLRKS